jgi:chemotaxis methyl-accepting protein methylase
MSIPSVSGANHTVMKSSVKSSALWTALRHIKHQLVLRFAKRENRIYTQFCRFPHQFRAVVEKVVPRLRPGVIGADTQPLDIVVFACCTGAEAFTLSYTLQKHFPNLRFRIRGFDLVGEVVERARLATFTREEVLKGPFVTDEFVKEAFDAADAGALRVKSSIAAPITFGVGNLLDGAFMQSLGKVDMVLAQNVLFHLPRPQARVAFGHLHDMLKAQGALLVNGMDTDMRVALTRRLNLEPLDYLVQEIHDDARVDRGAGWAGTYWGRRPFSRNSREWLRKYGTIFFKTS